MGTTVGVIVGHLEGVEDGMLDEATIGVSVGRREVVTVGIAVGVVVDVTSGFVGQNPQKGAPGRQAAGHISPLRQNWCVVSE